MEELFVRYGLYLWLGSVMMLVLALGWIGALQRRLDRVLAHYRLLTEGVEAAALPRLLEQHMEEVRRTTGQIGHLDERYANLEKVLRGAVQHMGLVRYNPFGDTGGDQSFSLALLNDSGDGVVISSLYARERTRVYAKPVTAARSTSHLSEEEEPAIAVAGAPSAPAGAGSGPRGEVMPT